jgi:hypothetical protein
MSAFETREANCYVRLDVAAWRQDCSGVAYRARRDLIS